MPNFGYFIRSALDLFMHRDITANYHGGNAQSVEAHESIIPLKLIQRSRILALAARRGTYGTTCDEAEIALDMTHQSCSARFSEMKRDGGLLATIDCRKTRSGRNARVFIVPCGW